MKEIIKKLVSRFGSLASEELLCRQINSTALVKLGKYWQEVEYFPWTEYALRPEALRLVINEVIVHGRADVLEVGTGLSTILLSKIPGVNLVSIEHDADWAAVVESCFSGSSVSRIITIPLAD